MPRLPSWRSHHFSDAWLSAVACPSGHIGRIACAWPRPTAPWSVLPHVTSPSPAPVNPPSKNEGRKGSPHVRPHFFCDEVFLQKAPCGAALSCSRRARVSTPARGKGGERAGRGRGQPARARGGAGGARTVRMQVSVDEGGQRLDAAGAVVRRARRRAELAPRVALRLRPDERLARLARHGSPAGMRTAAATAGAAPAAATAGTPHVLAHL